MPVLWNRANRSCGPLRELDQPLLDMSSPIPYCALQQLFDPFFPKGEFSQYWKALYLDGLSDEGYRADPGPVPSKTLATLDAVAVGCRGRYGARTCR